MRQLMGAKVADGVDGTETWVAPRDAAGEGATQDEAEAAGCMLWDLCVQEEHADYLVRRSTSCAALMISHLAFVHNASPRLVQNPNASTCGPSFILVLKC